MYRTVYDGSVILTVLHSGRRTEISNKGRKTHKTVFMDDRGPHSLFYPFISSLTLTDLTLRIKKTVNEDSINIRDYTGRHCNTRYRNFLRFIGFVLIFPYKGPSPLTVMVSFMRVRILFVQNQIFIEIYETRRRAKLILCIILF